MTRIVVASLSTRGATVTVGVRAEPDPAGGYALVCDATGVALGRVTRSGTRAWHVVTRSGQRVTLDTLHAAAKVAGYEEASRLLGLVPESLLTPLPA